MKDTKVIQNSKKAGEMLKKYSKQDAKNVLNHFKTTLAGLSVVEIDERIDEYGKNSVHDNELIRYTNKTKNGLIYCRNSIYHHF